MANREQTDNQSRRESWAKLPRKICPQDRQRAPYVDNTTEILLMYFHAWKRDFGKEVEVRGKKIDLEPGSFFIGIPELISRLPALRLTKDTAIGKLEKLAADGWIAIEKFRARGIKIKLLSFDKVSKQADKESDKESDKEIPSNKHFESRDPTRNPTRNPTRTEKCRQENPEKTVLSGVPSDKPRKVLKKDLKNVPNGHGNGKKYQPSCGGSEPGRHDHDDKNKKIPSRLLDLRAGRSQHPLEREIRDLLQKPADYRGEKPWYWPTHTEIAWVIESVERLGIEDAAECIKAYRRAHGYPLNIYERDTPEMILELIRFARERYVAESHKKRLPVD